MTPILKILLTALVTLAFSVLAHFNVVLPDTVTKPGLVAVLIMIAGTATIIWRADHGSVLSDALVWWKSKIIWTQIVGIGFALLALFNIVPGFDQAEVVDGVMTAVAVLTGGFALTSNRPIG